MNSSQTRREFIRLMGMTALAGVMAGNTSVLAQTGMKMRNLTPNAAWQIVVSNAASPAEVFAAEELQHYLALLNPRFALKIVRADVLPKSNAFVIGRHPQSADLLLKLAKEHPDAPDAYAVRTEGSIVSLTGGTNSGTQIAVWHLLEAQGVRWFFPTEKGQYVPRVEEVRVPDGVGLQAPTCDMRWIWPWVSGRLGETQFMGAAEHGIPAWQLHEMRLGAWSNFAIDPADRITNLGAGHSYALYLSADQYYDAHPEWFNLINGQRVKNGAQVCFTNAEGAREYTRNVKVQLRNSAGGDPRRIVVWCAPNDARAWCECENCQKLVDKDGSATSMVFNFANMVARELKDDYPDQKVVCYAYMNHATPPDHITLEPNVVPMLTHWTAAESFAFNHAKPGLAEGNNKFRDSYYRWQEMCQHFGVYQYYGHYIWFTPFPMKTQMDYDQKEMGKNPKFWGYCSEYHPNWGNQGMGRYLLAKLGWDSSQSADALVKDYCEKAFGPAAAPLEQYYATLQNAMDATSYIVGEIWDIRHVLTPPVIAECNSLTGQAKALMGQMDEGTHWRTDLVTRSWDVSALMGEAVALYMAGGGVPEAQALRAKLSEVKATLDSDLGVYIADADTTKPAFESFHKKFVIPLEAVPVGTHSYVDNMNFGGTSKFYGQFQGLEQMEWGWQIQPGAKASITLPVKAADGHVIKDLKVKCRTLGNGAKVAYSIGVRAGGQLIPVEGQPIVDSQVALPAEAFPASEVVLEIGLVSSDATPQLSLFGIDLDVTVE